MKNSASSVAVPQVTLNFSSSPAGKSSLQNAKRLLLFIAAKQLLSGRLQRKEEQLTCTAMPEVGSFTPGVPPFESKNHRFWVSHCAGYEAKTGEERHLVILKESAQQQLRQGKGLVVSSPLKCLFIGVSSKITYLRSSPVLTSYFIHKTDGTILNMG